MVVVDASVIYKWFDKSEENRDLAIQILEDHLSGENKIIILDLTLYELSNAWSTKSKLPLPKIKINLWDLQKYNLEIESVTFDLLNKTMEMAKEYGISVYDASYIVLAKEQKCNLITADEKLVSRVNLLYVKKFKDR